MASIKRVRTGWRARWRTPDGDSRSKTFRRRIDAEQHLTSVEHQKLSGAYVDAEAGKVAFAEYARAWQAGQVWRPNTVVKVDGALELHLLPHFGTRAIGSIRPSEIQAWVRGLADELAPSTTITMFRYLAAVFRAAVADRVIAVNPCQGIRLPRRERAQVVPLETEQVRALVDAMLDEYRALVVMVAGTGLRQGEAFAVSSSSLDFLRRALRVDQQVVFLPRTDPLLAAPKTEASRRTVPLPDVVLDTLAAHMKAYPTGPHGVVFTARDGGLMRRTAFNDAVWRPAVRAAGLPKGTGFHALRHYYASLLIRQGESVKVCQARLGHASASETLNTYSHLWPDSEDRTRAAVDSILGPAVSPACHTDAERGSDLR